MPGIDQSTDDEIEEVEPLDPEVLARRDAALRQVRQFGDPVLRSEAAAVEVFDKTLRDEIGRMEELMSDALGVGLAATQIGILHRLFIYRIGEEGPLKVAINPKLEWASQETDVMVEGCLSLQGVHVEVERPLSVRLVAHDETGAAYVVEAQELEARVIQHELDHLDGVLIIDRCPREQRKEAMRILREGAPR